MIIITLVIMTVMLAHYLVRKDFRVAKVIAMGFLIQLALLICYRLELSTVWQREVYWSDAETYWEAIQYMLYTGEVPEVFNPGFVIACYLVLRSFGLYHPVLINIFNLLLLDISVFLLAHLMLSKDVRSGNIRLFLTLTLLNPLISYSLLRELKDALFLFLSILCLLFVEQWVIRSIRGMLFGLLVLGAMSILIRSIRPWGFVIPWIFLLSAFIARLGLRPRSILPFITLLAISISFTEAGFKQDIEVWGNYGLRTSSTYEISEMLLGPAKLIAGPGPVRSLLGSQYFMFWTTTGNVAGFLGGMLWWLALPLLIIAFFKASKEKIMAFLPLLAFTAVFIVNYAIAYAGSVDLRFRGTLYPLIAAIALGTGKVQIDYRRSGFLYTSLEILIIAVGVSLGL